MPSLDILAAARADWDVPIGAYQVSGEYAAIEAAARNDWLDRRRALTEATTSMLRAGADFVITYAAADLAVWAREA
jgi:porphobilinogen synthase